jgi:hypothetical protein
MKRRQYLKPGDQFAAWTVLRFSHVQGTADIYDCRCRCGREFKVRKSHLRSGASSRCKSCASTTHGASRTDIFHIWQTMIARCHNPRHSGFRRYGARGISVCPRWRASFTAFSDDIGKRPSPDHSVDRVDNNGDYEPSNCRWASLEEQAQNRSNTRWITIDGRTQCLSAWAREMGLNAQTIHERLQRGWSERDAVFSRTA